MNVLTKPQEKALRNLALSSDAIGSIHHKTKQALQARELINRNNRTGEWFLTNDGLIAIDITPIEITSAIHEIRELQDEIVDLCLTAKLPFQSRVSQNMPDTISIGDLVRTVYPEHKSELLGVRYILRQRLNIFS